MSQPSSVKSSTAFQSLMAVHRIMDCSRLVDFLAPLAFRIYLFFPFWIAGTTKLSDIESTASWFEHSLNLPLPEFMAWMAGLAEAGGAVCLLAGFAVRYAVIPLMITMLVAIFVVHWDNGWAAIASSSDEAIFDRLSRARGILEEYGNYEWLTAKGSFAILQNGIEFGVTYFIMCLSLFFTGAGNYLSIDYWIKRCTESQCNSQVTSKQTGA